MPFYSAAGLPKQLQSRHLRFQFGTALPILRHGYLCHKIFLSARPHKSTAFSVTLEVHS
jgi:hypothetical protein